MGDENKYCEHGILLNECGGVSDECGKCMEETGGWETCQHGNSIGPAGIPDCLDCQYEPENEEE